MGADVVKLERCGAGDDTRGYGPPFYISYIGIDDGALFSIPVFSNSSAEDVEMLVHEEGDTFRRKRDDGTLAEPVIFERDDAGRVVAVVQHSYRSMKRR